MRMKNFGFLAIQFVLATSTLAAPPDCVPQTQLDVAKIDRQIVLIGETHGTNEIPAFTDGFVCSLLRAGRSVILAIEQDGDEQEALNTYLRSTGTIADRQALRQSRSWKTYSDGRGSAAMFGLVESMRIQRVAGQRVALIAIRKSANQDVPMEAEDRVPLTAPDNVLYGHINDSAMADSVMSAAILYRRYTVVVLAGESHTSTILAVSDNPMFLTNMPMGQLVAERMPVFVIGIESGGGEAWSMGASGGKPRPVEAGSLVTKNNRVDTMVRFEKLTSSPPARLAEP